MAVLLKIEEPPASSPDRFALWALGFRPFYLLASAFAALSIPLWALQFTGLLHPASLEGPIWHAHEMLFGFTLAVIVGFLFTAGRNWSGQATPTGARLMALAALWLAARVLVLTPWHVAAAIVNVAFPLAAAGALAVPLWKGRSHRNYFFVGLLVLMATACAVVHLSELGAIDLSPWVGIAAALDLLLFIVCAMAGRVVPMFTNNGVPSAKARRLPWLERTALGLVLAILVADAAGLHGTWMATLAFVAGLAHAARWVLWTPLRTRRTPLLWILHAAYLWIPIHLGLRALAEVAIVPASLATHALTAGAVGGMVIGMMTRTARGHTARPLRADAFDTTCYALVMGAAVARVLLPLLLPAGLAAEILLSATLWSAGFGLYMVRYWPALSRSRLDGRAG